MGFLSRRFNTSLALRSPPPLSTCTIQSLEQHYILLHSLHFLGQYLDWLPLGYYRWIRGYVLGVSIQV
jgi:hypothetical protein